MRKTIAIFAAMLNTAVLSGCGTMDAYSQGYHDTRPYAGVQLDLASIHAYCASAEQAQLAPWAPMTPYDCYVDAVYTAIDIPFSAAADTLLLPFTVPYTLVQAHPGMTLRGPPGAATKPAEISPGNAKACDVAELKLPITYCTFDPPGQ